MVDVSDPNKIMGVSNLIYESCSKDELISELIKLRQRNQELENNEQLYRTMFENSPEAILLARPDGTVLDVNPAGCDIFGWTKEEICTMGRSGMVDIYDIKTIEAIKERDETGRFHSELTCIRKDGSRFQGETTSKLFKTVDGQLLCSLIIRDITNRKKAEEILRKSEEKFSKAFHGGPIMMTLATVEEGKFIDTNEALCSSLGYTREQVIGHTSKELNLFVDRDLRQALGKMLMEQGRIENQEVDLRTKTGEIRQGLCWSELIYLDEQPCHITGLIDVTEQRRMEESLKYNEQRFKTCFDNMLDCINIYTAIRDQSGRITDFLIVYTNEAACLDRKMSKEELVGRSYIELFHDSIKTDIFYQYCDVIETGEPLILDSFSYDNMLHTHISEVYDYRAFKFDDGIVLSWRNITKQKKLEQEIARLDRLNMVGEMAAGIGHEVRNPITTVRGFLQLLSGKEECSKYNSYYTLMIEELDRANSIITEFLSLAKGKALELEVQSLNKIVENILPLIQSDATVSDKYIRAELEEVSKIPLDKKEINQLVINLVRNGLQAMSPGGSLKIKTFMAKEEIVLAVQDDGKGISQEVLEKIGTPFFTTKENGTGLGLAVCYSIIARHNAKIDIETGLTGTTFFVRFKKDFF